jgi:hypothetical protein
MAPPSIREVALNAQQQAKIEDLLPIGDTILANRDQSSLTNIQKNTLEGTMRTLKQTKRPYHDKTIVDRNTLSAAIHRIRE